MAAMAVVTVRTNAAANAQCQICNYWGHVASDCRNRFNPEFQPRNNNNQNVGNAVSTSYNTDAPIWHLDSGATDHLTSDLARLHLHERYGGTDHVQVYNGVGLSIAHIGHSL
jgi:hypothetical protein